MKKYSFLSDSLVYTGGYILYMMAQWLISIMIVNISGLNDAGYFGVAMTITSVFYMVASYGIRTYQISDLKPMFSDADYVVARLITTALGFIGCMVYSALFNYDLRQIVIIGVYMLFKCCEALYDVFHGIWQKRDQLLKVGISLTAKSVLNVVFFFVPYWITKDLLLGLVFMLLSAVVLLVMDIWYTRYKLMVTQLLVTRAGAVKALLKATFVMMVFILCSPALNAIPRLILEKHAGRELLGIYTSLATPTTLISAFASTVFIPLIPQYTKAYAAGDKSRIIKLLTVSIGIMVGIGVLACTAVVFLGHWAVKLVYGEQVAEHYQMMHGVIISVVLTSAIMCVNNFLTGIRKLHQELIFMLGGCLLCFLLSLILVPRYYMLGAVVALVVSQLVQTVAELCYTAALLKKQSVEQN